MATGYIKLWRQLEQKGAHRDGPVAQLLLWALLKVARFPRTELKAGRGRVELEAGQVDFTRRELADLLGLTEKQVRGAIERLAFIVDLTVEGPTQGRNFSVLTLCNFEEWQEARSAQGPTQGQPGANPGPTPSANPSSDKGSGPLKKEKKERKEKKTSVPEPAEPARARVLCNLIVAKMRERDPKAKGPPTDRARAQWLYEMDNINRLDGRPWDEIERVLRWALDDHFWRQNIRSAPTFRRQYERLRDGWVDATAKDGWRRGKKQDEEVARRAQRAEDRRVDERPSDFATAKDALAGILAGLTGQPTEEP